MREEKRLGSFGKGFICGLLSAAVVFIGFTMTHRFIKQKEATRFIQESIVDANTHYQRGELIGSELRLHDAFSVSVCRGVDLPFDYYDLRERMKTGKTKD